jgi:hypothetical protein
MTHRFKGIVVKLKMLGNLVKALLGILEVFGFPFVDYGIAKAFALGRRSHDISDEVTQQVEFEIVAL